MHNETKYMSVFRQLGIAAIVAATVFPLAANAGTFTTLYNFRGGNDGNYPSYLVYQAGALYGTDQLGKYGYGNVFRADAATGKLKVIYAFRGGADGSMPETGLILEGDALYGTTTEGGTGGGTVFSVDIKSHAEVAYPLSEFAGLIGLTYVAGTIYGLAESGGAHSDGGIFSFNPASGSLETLYSFSGPDGKTPSGQLVYENGLLYGTTMYGGKGCLRLNGCGTVFALNPTTGAESVLHAFSSRSGGRVPYLTLAYHAGSFIGDTEVGGNEACRRGCGVSYKINATSGQETVLEDFENRGENYSGITVVGGNAYETLPTGGSGGYGQLIEVNLKSGQQSVLYTFTGGRDGSNPQAALTYHKGAFYGSTDGGNGTIFKFVP